MDPRHPEQSISRLKELMKQYDRVEQDMKKASTSAQLAQLEREGGLVIQEICLVAPRIHEAMMQTSRNRRRDINRGIATNGLSDDASKSIEKIAEEVNKIADTVEEMAEIVEPKPRKKKTTKKKAKK